MRVSIISNQYRVEQYTCPSTVEKAHITRKDFSPGEKFEGVRLAYGWRGIPLTILRDRTRRTGTPSEIRIQTSPHAYHSSYLN